MAPPIAASKRVAPSAAEAEPDVFQQDVFEMLDSHSSGYLSIEQMKPVLSNTQRRRAIERIIQRCRRPDVGLSLKEFAAAFRNDDAVWRYYQDVCSMDMEQFGEAKISHAGSDAKLGWSQGKPLHPQSPSGANRFRRTSTTGDLLGSPSGARQAVREEANNVAHEVPAGAAKTAMRRVASLEAEMRRSSAPSVMPVPPPPAMPAPTAFLSTVPGGPPMPVQSGPPMPAPPPQGLARRNSIVLAATPADPTVLAALARGHGQAAPWASAPWLAPPMLPQSPSSLGPMMQAAPIGGSPKQPLPPGLVRPSIGGEKHEEANKLCNALAEIDRLQQQVAAAAKKDEELQEQMAAAAEKDKEVERLKQELEAAKEAQAVGEFTPVADRRRARASTGGIQAPAICSSDEEELDEEEPSAVLPAPPSSDSWEWPLSRNEKTARVQLIERQMHAIDRHTLVKQRRRLSLSSARNDFFSDGESDDENCTGTMG